MKDVKRKNKGMPEHVCKFLLPLLVFCESILPESLYVLITNTEVGAVCNCLSILLESQYVLITNTHLGAVCNFLLLGYVRGMTRFGHATLLLLKER